ncbi:MAG: hypothetical protein WA668_16805 [Candidatus Cybelea sp.]
MELTEGRAVRKILEERVGSVGRVLTREVMAEAESAVMEVVAVGKATAILETARVRGAAVVAEAVVITRVLVPAEGAALLT